MEKAMEKLTRDQVKEQLNKFFYIYLTKEKFVHAIREKFNILLEHCSLIWEDNRKILVVFKHDFGDCRIVAEFNG